MTGQDVVRLSVNLAPDVAGAFNDAEGVRRAISLWKLLDDRWAAGDSVFIRSASSGECREVKMVRDADMQQIIDEPGYVRAVFDAADVDEDMRELAERFAHQDEARAAAEWEIVGAMDDDEGLL